MKWLTALGSALWKSSVKCRPFLFDPNNRAALRNVPLFGAIAKSVAALLYTLELSV